MIRIPIIVAFFIIFLSCNNRQDQVEKKSIPGNEKQITISSAFDLEPRFAELDSLQVIFFDDPYGDSIRYTRFFRFVNSNEPLLLEETKKHLHQPYTLKDKIDTCRSDGKIYLLAKGEPVKTLYFSTNCPQCCYTYFIRDGSFYYLEMNPAFLQQISSLKKRMHK